MKRIIVKPENAEKIMTAIDAVQARARERRINGYYEIESIISAVENRIGKMPKKALNGTSVLYDQRQHFPQAYKYKPNSTWIKLEFMSGKWYLTNCGRDECPNTNGYQYILRLSETAKAEILNRYI